MSRGGIIIQNKSDGRGMMLPEREGSGAFSKLPFVSMTYPKEKIGINPVAPNVIIKTKKIKPKKERKNKKEEEEEKLYPLSNYRQLKTAQQFWKKNENPVYEQYNKKSEIKKQNKTIIKENINNIKDNDNINNISIKTPQKIKLNRIINKSALARKKLEDEKKEDESINEIKQKKKEVKFIQEINNKNKEVSSEKNDNVENNIEINTLNQNKNDEKYKEEEKKDNEKEENEKKIIDDPLLEEDLNENENIEEVINYLNGLDYDKYCKDMEIREALTLLKNKIDKEKEEKKLEEEKNKNKVTVEGVEQNEKNEKDEEKKDNDEESTEKDKNKLILPEINQKVPEQKPCEIVDEEELKRKEEIKKYKIAEQIAKTDQMKAVHSVNSIRKLLQREGLDQIEEPAPLKITVIKESPLAKYDGYISNKLPFLHSLPLV